MYNKVILVGRLTRDIEIRYLPSGQALGKSAIATSRKYKAGNEMKEETCFIDVTFWGRSAEIANQYLRRGSKILIEGRLTFEQWSDNMGNKRSKHSVTVETLQMLDSKDEQNYQPNNQYNQQGGNYNQPSGHQQQNSGYNQQQQNDYNSYNSNDSGNSGNYPNQKENIPEIDIDDDDIPF